MKKSTLAALVLTLPLTIASAWAATTSTLSNSGLEISDHNSKQKEIVYSNVFDLSSLSFSSISNIKLTFSYGDIGSNETWKVYFSGTDKSWDFDSSVLNKNKNIFEIEYSDNDNDSSKKDLFDSILGSKHLYYGFAENTPNTDKFTLKGATLSVTGIPAVIPSVPEPETYALFAAGLGLIGAIARRRKAKSA